jgi:hypothetical protein
MRVMEFIPCNGVDSLVGGLCYVDEAGLLSSGRKRRVFDRGFFMGQRAAGA